MSVNKIKPIAATKPVISIGGRSIGEGYPVYIVAEISANHGHSFKQAVDILRAAKEAGADAIKLQTYTPDTMTIDCEGDPFTIRGTVWDGRRLYELYKEAYTPWEWHPKLKAEAESIGIDFFSTPFDSTSVDYLEELDVPVFKIASFELVDIPLLRKVSATRKPVILSTGMATLDEIHEAAKTLRTYGTSDIALLKCTSAYPAPLTDMNLSTLPHMTDTFNSPVGISDHTLGITVPVAAVSLGASIIEKHITLSRDIEGPDSKFSLEPQEFSEMVTAVREVELAKGHVKYGVSSSEAESRAFRRSLFVVKDMKAGEKFNSDSIRSIRPGFGLHTRHIDEVIGKVAARDISRGTPLNWDLIDSEG